MLTHQRPEHYARVGIKDPKSTDAIMLANSIITSQCAQVAQMTKLLTNL